MTEQRRPARPARPLVLGALSLVLLLATLGSFGAWFGLMTQCTDTYSCTTTSCLPCRDTRTWLDLGWAVQGVLLLVGAALAVLGARCVHVHAARLGALLLGLTSTVLFTVTTVLAVRSL